jgi:L-alanine-DL-glutamate epimerase-like enolase superfamily enzyme
VSDGARADVDERTATYDRVAGLPLVVEACVLERLELAVTAEFTRVTTVVRLRGHGEEGVGEDVTYHAEEHESAVRASVEGEWESFAAFSGRLEHLDLFEKPPAFGVYRNYRRWAYESAALDLALRQAGQTLADALGREPRPVRFVVSFRLGSPPTTDRCQRWRELYPSLRFKLDPTSDWDEPLVEELAAMGAIDVLDLKGAYRGTPVDQPADPRLYRLVAEGFPEAWIEDPDLADPDAMAVLEPHRHRITWDAPIHSVAEIEALLFPPRMLNVKPSRFGSLAALFETYDYCAARGIGLYGGGQFELGPGRGQIQYLAALFHADAPNDVAPGAFNYPEPRPGLPASPLEPNPADGFRWGETRTKS